MMCGSDSYPKSKDVTVGLLNNYHVRKQLTRTIPVKEEVSFTQKNSDTKVDTKTKKDNKKLKSNCFRCSNPYHWAY